jgi:hypothetical protein
VVIGKGNKYTNAELEKGKLDLPDEVLNMRDEVELG